MAWSLDHRFAVILLTVAIFATAIPLNSLVGRDWIPADDQSELTLYLNMPIGTSLDAKVVRINEQRVPGMLGDYLEAVVLWCVEYRDHRFIDNISDGAAVLRRFPSWYINADKRHKQVP